ncbi:hypothetical protein M422DRAFT_268648 [Sphaerobolus stellatus SS14]|uniref:Uncharacterized protein n=1 Tax=Sphaerobolus stellatus (strain SS14) TaxID=990650 RepID=A0A0C9U6I2_SPHS4|nr:hypothetical protein M422DRAFT_268648 [Sphaerobolus stellatus SS14]
MEYERLLRLSKAGLLNPQDRPRSIQPSEDTRETAIRDNPRKSIRYAPFDGIEDNDTDSETTVRNHREGYMLDQNVQTIMEKSPLAKAGVKVTPPNKYSREQSFEALETFVKGLLR